MLKLEGVSLDRNGRRILEGIDLDVAEGEIRFLVGPSGSGKTTILRVVSGLELPDRGQVQIGGEPASAPHRLLLPPHRRNIGMVFQDGALWDHMSVEQHLRFGLQRHVADRETRDRRVTETLAWVGLAKRSKERPGHLSGGERQRLGLARALVARPRLLLLDEPLAHVDLPSQRRLAEKLAGIAKEHGLTLLWVTHRPGEVSYLGGDVSLLQDGRIVDRIDQGDVPQWLRTVGA